MTETGWVNYGAERRVSNDARMYVLTNEQINLIASLVTTTNDVFSFQIPYPFYLDQQEKAMIIERIDFIHREFNATSPKTTDNERLSVDLQYSDKEPAANWDGAGEDVEDENIQAMFDGPFIFGSDGWSGAPDADATLVVMVPGNYITNVHYYPPDNNGLDAFFPVTVVFTNMSYSRDLVDQTVDKATFAAFEAISLRIYFTTRNLTPQEKSLMATEYYGMVPFS